MHTSIMARGAAVITATALAFSLGTGPVSAAETSSVAVAAGDASTPSQTFAASSVDVAGVPTSAIRFRSGVVTSAGTTRFFGTGTFTDKAATSVSVKINGRSKGSVALLYSSDPASNMIAVDIPRGWGSGKVRVSINGVSSNQFYARKHIKTTRGDGLFFSIRHSGNKVKLAARKVKILNPSNGKYVSLRKIKVQQRKNGKWRTLKTIKLNSNGNGSVTYKTRSKYHYRLKSAQSSKQILFQSESSRKM